MFLMKYKKEIILLIVLILLSVGLFIVSFVVREPRVIAFLPGSGMMDQTAIIFMSIMAIGSICGVVGGFILAPIYLILHKLILGRRGLTYGIQERPSSDRFVGTFKGFFPSLMAINFSLMFATNQAVIRVIVDPAHLSTNFSDITAPLITFFGLVIITSGIAMFLFSPVWSLNDSGITYTNKDKVESTSDPVEIQSIGGWFNRLLRGYAGIGVIIGYIGFSLNLIPTLIETGTGIGPMFSIVVIFGFPFLISILTLPCFIFLDIVREQRKGYILSIARRIGITETIEV